MFSGYELILKVEVMCSLISKINNASNADTCPYERKPVDKDSEIFSECLILKDIVKFGAGVIDFVGTGLLTANVFIKVFMHFWWLANASVETGKDFVFVNNNCRWNHKPYR